MNRLIRSRMKPRQVGKHVVGTFKVQIQQFLQCALTMEVADERRRAETLSTLVNNSSEATGSTQMRASERARERRTYLFLVRRRRLARHNCHCRRIIWETRKRERKWLATRDGARYTGAEAATQQWSWGCDFGLQYVCFGKEILIISLCWQRSISAHLLRLAKLHQPGVPPHLIPTIQETHNAIRRTSNSAKKLTNQQPAQGGGGLGERGAGWVGIVWRGVWRRRRRPTWTDGRTDWPLAFR